MEPATAVLTPPAAAAERTATPTVDAPPTPPPGPTVDDAAGTEVSPLVSSAAAAAAAAANLTPEQEEGCKLACNDYSFKRSQMIGAGQSCKLRCHSDALIHTDAALIEKLIRKISAMAQNEASYTQRQRHSLRAYANYMRDVLNARVREHSEDEERLRRAKEAYQGEGGDKNEQYNELLDTLQAISTKKLEKYVMKEKCNNRQGCVDQKLEPLRWIAEINPSSTFQCPNASCTMMFTLHRANPREREEYRQELVQRNTERLDLCDIKCEGARRHDLQRTIQGFPASNMLFEQCKAGCDPQQEERAIQNALEGRAHEEVEASLQNCGVPQRTCALLLQYLFPDSTDEAQKTRLLQLLDQNDLDDQKAIEYLNREMVNVPQAYARLQKHVVRRELLEDREMCTIFARLVERLPEEDQAGLDEAWRAFKARAKGTLEVPTISPLQLPHYPAMPPMAASPTIPYSTAVSPVPAYPALSPMMTGVPPSGGYDGPMSVYGGGGMPSMNTLYNVGSGIARGVKGAASNLYGLGSGAVSNIAGAIGAPGGYGKDSSAYRVLHKAVQDGGMVGMLNEAQNVASEKWDATKAGLGWGSASGAVQSFTGIQEGCRNPVLHEDNHVLCPQCRRPIIFLKAKDSILQALQQYGAIQAGGSTKEEVERQARAFGSAINTSLFMRCPYTRGVVVVKPKYRPDESTIQHDMEHTLLDPPDMDELPLGTARLECIMDADGDKGSWREATCASPYKRYPLMIARLGSMLQAYLGLDADDATLTHSGKTAGPSRGEMDALRALEE